MGRVIPTKSAAAAWNYLAFCTPENSIQRPLVPPPMAGHRKVTLIAGRWIFGESSLTLWETPKLRIRCTAVVDRPWVMEVGDRLAMLARKRLMGPRVHPATAREKGP